MIKLFKSLSDDTRLRIISILRHGEFSVQEITHILAMGQSRISRHLKILTESGVTGFRRDGTWVYYRLNESDAVIREMLGLLGKWMNQSADHERLHESVRMVLENRRTLSRSFFAGIGLRLCKVHERYIDAEVYYRELVKRIGGPEILADLGCGQADLIRNLAGIVPRMIGIDNSPEMLRVAGEKLRGIAGVELRLGNIEHLPLKDGEVDCVTAALVLHHLAQPSAVFSELFRVLDEGGRLIIVDFARHNRERMRSEAGDLWLGFSENELCKWANDAGFSSVAISGMEGGRGRIKIIMLQGVKLVNSNRKRSRENVKGVNRNQS